MEDKGQVLLVILRAKKIAVGLFGLCVLCALLVWMFVFIDSSISSNMFCKIAEAVFLLLALVCANAGIKALKMPVLVAYEKGLQLNITFSVVPVFIPWTGIREIKSEMIQSMHSGGRRHRTQMFGLSISLGDEYAGRLPKFLKGVYKKLENRLYFIALSVSIDAAVEKLNGIKLKADG